MTRKSPGPCSFMRSRKTHTSVAKDGSTITATASTRWGSGSGAGTSARPGGARRRQREPGRGRGGGRAQEDGRRDRGQHARRERRPGREVVEAAENGDGKESQ